MAAGGTIASTTSTTNANGTIASGTIANGTIANGTNGTNGTNGSGPLVLPHINRPPAPQHHGPIGPRARRPTAHNPQPTARSRARWCPVSSWTRPTHAGHGRSTAAQRICPLAYLLRAQVRSSRPTPG
jgi:hypothetical protein